jgi:Xaa-Pro aminopeptidase
MTQANYAHRLGAVREKMRAAGLDFLFISGSDPHQNEYVPAHWQWRRWLCGFDGSAGDLLIGHTEAELWTDSRYTLQAQAQLDPQLVKVSTRADWLAKQTTSFVLGIDPAVVSINQCETWRKLLAEQAEKNTQLKLISDDFFNNIWTDRPALDSSPAMLYREEFAGCTRGGKLALVRQQLAKQDCHAVVLSSLDAIAWLTNLRGADIPYNPFKMAYAIVTQDQTTLFIDLNSCSTAIIDILKHDHIVCLPYTQFGASLSQLSQLSQLSEKIWLDPNQNTAWIKQQLGTSSVYLAPSPINRLKAVKNLTEQRGTQEAHRLDGIAMVRFLAWLDKNWAHGVSELSAAKKLDALRREHPDCVDLSFNTISAFGPHGAIVHYAVTETSDLSITDQSMYLVDSGGQYYTGTTDITRSIHLGTPSEDQIYHYTLVLKGQIDLAMTIFPQGTCGEHLNAIAHAPLWQAGLDFYHGTGHGVGHFACVHEFPPSISARATGEALQAGMVVSNEPGFYHPHHYGIRLENLCLIQTVDTDPHRDSPYGPFLRFHTLSLVPYCRRLINIELLGPKALKWLNDYHARVYQELAPLINEASVLNWLERNTAKID